MRLTVENVHLGVDLSVPRRWNRPFEFQWLAFRDSGISFRGRPIRDHPLRNFRLAMRGIMGIILQVKNELEEGSQSQSP